MLSGNLNSCLCNAKYDCALSTRYNFRDVRQIFVFKEQLRKIGEVIIKKIPIIVASNLGQKTDIDTALSLGAIDFLIKSNISLKELVTKIEEHLPRKKE